MTHLFQIVVYLVVALILLSVKLYVFLYRYLYFEVSFKRYLERLMYFIKSNLKITQIDEKTKAHIKY